LYLLTTITGYRLLALHHLPFVTPEMEMMQRRLRNACLNFGFSLTASPRALLSIDNLLASAALGGTKPHCINDPVLPSLPSALTIF
jgi:hypothetical protein